MTDVITPKAAECAADALLAVVAAKAGDVRGVELYLGNAIATANQFSRNELRSFLALIASLSETSGSATLLEGAAKLRAEGLDRPVPASEAHA